MVWNDRLLNILNGRRFSFANNSTVYNRLDRTETKFYRCFIQQSFLSIDPCHCVAHKSKTPFFLLGNVHHFFWRPFFSLYSKPIKKVLYTLTRVRRHIRIVFFRTVYPSSYLYERLHWVFIATSAYGMREWFTSEPTAVQSISDQRIREIDNSHVRNRGRGKNVLFFTRVAAETRNKVSPFKNIFIRRPPYCSARDSAAVIVPARVDR